VLKRRVLVISSLWKEVSRFYGCEIGTEYLSVAGKWLDKKKYRVTNMITAAVLRRLWLTSNDFVFNKHVWSDVKLIWRLIRKQRREPGDDGELVVFPGYADSRAIADFERVMMFGTESPGRRSESWVPSLA
jgi:hypothetical protein